MVRRWGRAFIIVGLFFALVGASGVAPGRASDGGLPESADQRAEFAPGRIVVRFRDSAFPSAQAQILRRYGVAYERTIYGSGAQIVRVPEGRELEASAALGADPAVAYAHPDYLSYVFVTPNDPSLSKQWAHTEIIGSQSAWDLSTGSTTLVIAVVDSGVDETHPDLQTKLLPGHSFLNQGEEDSTPHDLNGHGTHVAGIAAAATNNGVGVAGTSWGGKILPVRVMGADGKGWNSDITAGIYWAVDHGADIVNLSLGSSIYDAHMQQAVYAAHDAGVLVVAAMGNAGSSTVYYPAGYNYVFAVAATTRTDAKATYSNYGSHCDIAAPGGDGYVQAPTGIYSTMPTYDVYLTLGNCEPPYFCLFNKDYDYLVGTSQATPYVSGLAALVWSLKPEYSPDQVQQLIESTAVDLGTTGKDNYFGWGRIDAFAALRSVFLPDPPVLYTISNADKDGSYLVDWAASVGATSYRLEEDDNATFSSPVARYVGSSTQYSVVGQAPGVWYYRVQASNTTGTSAWSATQSVGVAPAAPTLSAIANPEQLDAYALSWTAVAGAQGYLLQEDDNLSFTSPTTRYDGTSTAYDVTGQPGGTWYYRAYAYNAVGTGPASNIVSTTVAAAGLSAPVLNAIANADKDGNYALDWSSVGGATSYTLEESSTPYFSTTLVIYSGAVSDYTVIDQGGGWWYYRVRAHSATESSPWSNTQATVVMSYFYLPLALRNFTLPPPVVLLNNGDFESGRTVWEMFSEQGYDVILTEAEDPNLVPPHSGLWASWLGGAVNETAYIQQTVYVSPTASILSYYHWIDSLDVCGNHGKASILVSSAPTRSYDLCTGSATTGWVRQELDLTPYAGGSVTLRFQVVTDATNNSSYFLDDIAWQSSVSSVEAALAQPSADAALPRTR